MENCMKTQYCSELDEWISHWLIVCDHVIRQLTGIRAVWHSRSVIRFDDIMDIFYNDTCFGKKKKKKKKKHVAEELVNLETCLKRIRNISSEEDSNVVNSTEVVVRESDSIYILQRSTYDFYSHSNMHCDLNDFSSRAFIFLHLDSRALKGKHKCVIDTDDFSIFGSHN